VKKASAPSTIDEYIASAAPEVQPLLRKIRATVRKAAPEAEEAIKYQVPTFVLGGNLVHFAAFKNHIGFYPAPSGMKKFERELAGYRSGKGSVQFPLDEPIPYALITEIVKFRVQEAAARPARKKK
jgi:uncharacterized protein YdhG (YjbR/CyaY superfamily)